MFGILTDCIYKLGIIMPVLCNMDRFTLGYHVKVIGVLTYGKYYAYLWILNEEAITIVSEKKS